MKSSRTILTAILLLTVADSVNAQSDSSPEARPGNAPRQAGDLRKPDRLRVGDPAPDFTLRTKDGGKEIQLAAFKGKRPVLLVFGSYT